MYLKNIKLWNFRKFGKVGFDLTQPHLNLDFTKGLNVLIGENDSGKTAIVDAIKLVLKTHSFEWIKLENEDFYYGSDRMRIELLIEELSDDEAKHFTERLCWTNTGTPKPYLRLIFDAKRDVTTSKLFTPDVCAGADTDGHILTAQAKEFLKVTYLKPLRDAQSELIPKKGSRLSQILQGHEAFKGKEDTHDLVSHFKTFNDLIENYFKGKDSTDNNLPDQLGKGLKDEIDGFIESFFEKDKKSKLNPSDAKLKIILERLGLYLSDDSNPGLGSLNRLFMASELLHLKKANWEGLRLGLIEELEAHLHPQSQMQVIEVLQKQKEIQLILTTHSPNIGSKLKLENLIICHNNNAFPMGKDYTKLSGPDYTFLERFLDVTKANLFFAKGVILVEGWAEEILLPSLAKKIGINLTERGVSIVNLGNIAFLRYSHAFLRKDTVELQIPVSIVTDVDIPEYEKTSKTDATGTKSYEYIKKNQTDIDTSSVTKADTLKQQFDAQQVKSFIAKSWTLEYSIHKSPSLTDIFKNVFKIVHPQIEINNTEQELAAKLINKGLNKTEIAYQLAEILENDINLPIPLITIDENDEQISYLINAIKYACKII